MGIRMRGAALGLSMALLALTGCGGDDGGGAKAASASGAVVSGAKASADPLAAQIPADAKAAAARLGAPTPTFVGKVTGTDAYVAITENADGTFTAYVCDSAQIALWFSGTRNGTSFTATHKSGAVITAEKVAAGYKGTVTISGTSRAFDTTAAAYPAGLWQGFEKGAEVATIDAAGRYGWVVLGDGSQRGAKVKQTATGSGGAVEPGTGTSTDGTVATPSTPPPTRRSGDLSETECKALAHSYYEAVIAARNLPEDSLKRSVVMAYAITMFRVYYNGGCVAVWGEL